MKRVEQMKIVRQAWIAIRKAADEMFDAYTECPDLNDLQPKDTGTVLPLSIDEWICSMGSLIDDWGDSINDESVYQLTLEYLKPKYKVCDVEFDSFDDVVKWAWNECQIEASDAGGMSMEDKHKACKELERIVRGGA